MRKLISTFPRQWHMVPVVLYNIKTKNRNQGFDRPDWKVGNLDILSGVSRHRLKPPEKKVKANINEYGV